MNSHLKIVTLFLILSVVPCLCQAQSTDSSLSSNPPINKLKSVYWNIDGVMREAIASIPTSVQPPPPVVFIFPDHGVSAASAAKTLHFESFWPEALIIYMQGLPTPSLADPDGRDCGWQHGVGDQKDRDLKFFDAVMDSIKKQNKFDMTRVYATGQGNGGGLVYCLWASRPDVLAAVAPSACSFSADLKTLSPLPILHIAGRNDPVVAIEKQQTTMESVRHVDRCEEQPRTWPTPTDSGLTGAQFSSNEGLSFVSLLHDAGHTYPDAAVPEVVKFFKANARKPEADVDDDISDNDIMDLISR